MRSFQQKLSDAWGRLFGPRGGSPEVRYRIFNMTRNTSVADSAEVADNGQRRKKGLLGRSGLSGGEGLWIVPCEAVHTFGMKFAIDLVYLDRRSRVVKVRKQVPPGRLSVCLRAHSVVELPTGTIQASRTQRGDHLSLEPGAAVPLSSN